MFRAFTVATTILAATMFFGQTAAQEPSDVTLEGEVEVTQVLVTPTRGAELGPGTIRITFTPELDGVLRVELLNLRILVGDARIRLHEKFHSAEWYYWPPVAVENGRFSLDEYLFYRDLIFIEELPLPIVRIEGEVVNNTDIAGTLAFRTVHDDDSITTGWSADQFIVTPPDSNDSRFEAVTEAGDDLSLTLSGSPVSDITSFEIAGLSLAPCFPGETFSVRAFFEPSKRIRIVENRSIAFRPVEVDVVGEERNSVVRLQIDEVEGSSASGTVRWSTEHCGFEVGWQTAPASADEPPPTPAATTTGEPAATPSDEPSGLPAAGARDGRGAPLAAMATLTASLGLGLALLGVRRVRS